MSPGAPASPEPGRLRERAARWTKILAAFASAQGLAQLLSQLAGLIFSRTMEVHEYALFTLGASAIGFLIFITDLGSNSSLIYFFHHSRSETARFSPFHQAVRSLRSGALVVGVVAVLVFFPWVATLRGFTLSSAWLAALAVVATIVFQVPASIDLLLHRLANRYGLAYRAEVIGAAVRLALAAGLAALAFLPAWAALGTGALATAVIAWLARSGPSPERVATELAPYRRKVLRYLLPTLPSAVYFAFQGQLVVWLAASFGQTRTIAEVGALGRLGLIFGLFSTLSSTVFLPHLARIHDEGAYWRRYLAFGLFLALISVGMLALAALLPEPFLWLVGPNYSGLDHELLLVVAGAGIHLLGSYAVAVNGARSWNRWQSGAMGILVLCQAGLASLLPLGSTAGLLWFGLGSAAVGLALQVVMTGIGFLRPRWVHW